MRINTQRWLKRRHQLHAMKYFVRLGDVHVVSKRSPPTYMNRSWGGRRIPNQKAEMDFKGDANSGGLFFFSYSRDAGSLSNLEI